MGKEVRENPENYENKDNFGSFNDYSLDYDDELELEDTNKNKYSAGPKEEFEELKDNTKDPYDYLNDQIDHSSLDRPVFEEEEKPKTVKKKSSFSLFDSDNKLVKYAIYGFAGLIALLILLAIFSSCSRGSGKKENIESSVSLTVGEKHSFANEVGNYEWTSSNNDVATVNTTGEIEAIGEGKTTITITSGNKIITYTVEVKPLNETVLVTSVKFEKNTLDLEIGAYESPIVNVLPNNATNVDLSWYSSNDAVATVDSSGKITAVGVGSCTITVKSSNGYSDICLVKVTKGSDEGVVGEIKEILIDVSNIVLKSGIKYTLNYDISPADARGKISWSSSDESVATVEDGVITTVGQGTIAIEAKNGDAKQIVYVTVVKGSANTPDVISDGKTVEVEAVTLNQTSMSLEVGGKYTLVASVAPENATDKTVKWTTSNSSIATVDGNGNVTAVNAGTAIISVTTANGKTASCNLTVKAKAEVSPDYKVSLNLSSVNLNVNDIATLTATITPNNYANNVTWTTSNDKVATVANGVVKAVGKGSATITATLSNGAKATCNVTVSQSVINPLIVRLNASKVELKPNGTSQLTATILPNNATNKSIKWSSSNSNVATVDGNGKVTAKSNGSCIITATASNGVKATATVIVNGGTAISLDKTSATIYVGKTVKLTATITNASKKDLKWTTSDKSIATVTNGTITGVKAGKATITATIPGASAKCTVTVKKK